MDLKRGVEEEDVVVKRCSGCVAPGGEETDAEAHDCVPQLEEPAVAFIPPGKSDRRGTYGIEQDSGASESS